MRKEWLEICALLGFYAAQIGSLHEIMAVWRENGNTSATSTSFLLQSYILRYFNGQYLLLCVKFQRQHVKKDKKRETAQESLTPFLEHKRNIYFCGLVGEKQHNKRK
jgi:hypothetical protein